MKNKYLAWPLFRHLMAVIICTSLYECGYQKASGSEIHTDICILGGSEAGFTAAIQAARLGKQVVLVEPTGHPGGMMVEGIVSDIRFGSSAVIGGIAREVYTAIESYYGRVPEFGKPGWYSQYEPSVAEGIIEKLIKEENRIRIVRISRIRETGGVSKKGTEIESIYLENGMTIHAQVYIDASTEGDLIHLAGISTETIREGNARYGETKNGIQTRNEYRQFGVKVDPYKVPGDANSGLIPTIQPGELGEYGSPDKHIQGYCFRLCLTRDEKNRVNIPKPENYDPGYYEIYRRYLKAGGQLFFPQVNRASGKTDLGSWHDLSANLYGENWEYPAGSYALRDSIVKYHRDFTHGLIWFLQNDPGVDEQTRQNWADWGTCKDEFTDNHGWPHRLYIRSARRIISDYVITQHHTRRVNPDTVREPVAIAWWPPDMHHAQRIVKDGYAYNEGFVFGGNDWKPFGISWRALVPRESECTNLITPTCPSSSYVAYGAIRILPTFMILGQSAGCIAVIAFDRKVKVQKINYSELRSLLESGDQILDIPSNWPELIMSEND